MWSSRIEEQLTDADREALERAERDLGGVFGDGRVPVPELRDRLDQMMTASGLPDDVTVTELSAGGVPALRVEAPVVDHTAAIVWLHGGGYVIGSAHGYRAMAAAVSAASGHPVVVPDYRRAPEHPYPAALEDAQAVMGWAAQTYGDRWVLAGDSAGGGLTTASLMRARDAGMPMPAAAILVSPLADLTASGASFDTHAAEDVAISRRSVKQLAFAYLGGHDPRDPHVSPVFGTYDRMPPTLIMASDREVLLDDARTLHAAVQHNGSRSTLSIYAGVCHAWTMFASYMPRAQRAVAEIAAFVDAALGVTRREANDA
ncbi:alpha/beta hydrolase [Mycolicibacterium litorale]|uniref:alpha/beta hydrolase n=1 Tax=Mycolicibacterium litorale TaxID=758802 RepID=UPI003CF763A5